MTLEEFRAYRDQHALDGFRRRWLVLAQREKQLRAEIARLKATEKPKVVKDTQHEKGSIYWRLQWVTAEMDAILRDVRRRRVQLFEGKIGSTTP